MGASSVTGVGQGHAGLHRGPGNNRNKFASLVDSHIIWQGKADFVDNMAVIRLPDTIQLPPEQLAIFVSGVGVAVQKNVDADGNLSDFTLIGIGDSIDFIVVKSLNDTFCTDMNLVP